MSVGQEVRWVVHSIVADAGAVLLITTHKPCVAHEIGEQGAITRIQSQINMQLSHVHMHTLAYPAQAVRQAKNTLRIAAVKHDADIPDLTLLVLGMC